MILKYLQQVQDSVTGIRCEYVTDTPLDTPSPEQTSPPLSGPGRIVPGSYAIIRTYTDVPDPGAPVFYSDETPLALGTATPGTGQGASRYNHVHPMPSASDVGAASIAALAAVAATATSAGTVASTALAAAGAAQTDADAAQATADAAGAALVVHEAEVASPGVPGHMTGLQATELAALVTAKASRPYRITVGFAAAGDTAEMCNYLDTGDGVQLQAALTAAGASAYKDVWVRSGSVQLAAGLPTLTVPDDVRVYAAGRGLTTINGTSINGVGMNILTVGARARLYDMTISSPAPVAGATYASIPGMVSMTTVGQVFTRVDVNIACGNSIVHPCDTGFFYSGSTSPGGTEFYDCTVNYTGTSAAQLSYGFGFYVASSGTCTPVLAPIVFERCHVTSDGLGAYTVGWIVDPNTRMRRCSGTKLSYTGVICTPTTASALTLGLDVDGLTFDSRGLSASTGFRAVDCQIYGSGTVLNTRIVGVRLLGDGNLASSSFNVVATARDTSTLQNVRIECATYGVTTLGGGVQVAAQGGTLTQASVDLLAADAQFTLYRTSGTLSDVRVAGTAKQAAIYAGVANVQVHALELSSSLTIQSGASGVVIGSGSTYGSLSDSGTGTKDFTLQNAAAGVTSTRKLGTGSTDACAGDDSRLTDSRAPTGAAGGGLAGTYPNPTIASPITLATQSDPSAPSAGNVSLYMKSWAGRGMPAFREPNAIPFALQPFFGRIGITMSAPGTAAAANTNWNCIQPTHESSSFGAQLAEASSGAGVRAQQRRYYIDGGTSTTSYAGYRGQNLCYWRGNSAGLGGFFFTVTFALSSAPSTQALFAGLIGSTAAFAANVVPSNQVDCIFFGYDAGDSPTCQIMHNDSSGACTKIPLTGWAFLTTTDVIRVSFFCAPNSTTISYLVENLATGAAISGTTGTSNLPTSTTFMTHHVHSNVATVSGRALLEWFGTYGELGQ